MTDEPDRTRRSTSDGDRPDKSKSREPRTPTPVEDAEADKEDHTSQREALPLSRDDDDAKSIDGNEDRARRRN